MKLYTSVDEHTLQFQSRIKSIGFGHRLILWVSGKLQNIKQRMKW